MTDASRIRVAAVRSAHPAEVEATLHGCATAALLQQRGVLPSTSRPSRSAAAGSASPVRRESAGPASPARSPRADTPWSTDDLAAVTWWGSRPALEPGPTRMRIWGSSARQLGIQSEGTVLRYTFTAGGGPIQTVDVPISLAITSNEDECN